MCLNPDYYDKFLPHVIIHGGDESLRFLQNVILKQSVSISESIAGRKRKILGGLARELGRHEYGAAPVKEAIKFAAISILKHTGDDDQGRTDAQSAAVQYVTPQFLPLLVNVVQIRWNIRSRTEKLQALRSLYELMDFLLPAAAAQYFPHILAIVNSAMDSICLQLLAAKCLSKFVKLVAGHHVEPVAQNLMTIVVSLIPLLEEASVNEISGNNTKMLETRAVAIGLLEFLSGGDVGEFLAPHFRQIPFLPPSPLLGNVHKALRDNGVDYDNLIVLSNSSQEGRMEGLSATDTSATVDSRGSSTSASVGTRKVIALQKRINTICTLLGNENTSVRKVTLNHLISLLRSNRSHFCTLIENEVITTASTYLTTMSNQVTTLGRKGKCLQWIDSWKCMPNTLINDCFAS